MDNTSEVRAFYSIMLPLVRPGLAAVAIFTAIQAWKEFLFGLTMTTGGPTPPLTVGHRVPCLSVRTHLGVDGRGWLASCLVDGAPGDVTIRTEDGPRERLVSSRPAHRLDDDVDELASFCKGAALACGTGANPRQPVDPGLDALDIAEPLKGVVHVDDQIAHHFDPGPGPS